MPAPMSMDLRLRIVGAVERGSSIREAARRFAVSPSAAIKLMQRVRATGSAAPAIGLAVVVLTAGSMSGAYSQQPPIYGSQLMTEQERAEYRVRMRNAASEEKREQIRLQHHAQMQRNGSCALWELCQCQLKPMTNR